VPGDGFFMIFYKKENVGVPKSGKAMALPALTLPTALMEYTVVCLQPKQRASARPKLRTN